MYCHFKQENPHESVRLCHYIRDIISSISCHLSGDFQATPGRGRRSGPLVTRQETESWRQKRSYSPFNLVYLHR